MAVALPEVDTGALIQAEVKALDRLYSKNAYMYAARPRWKTLEEFVQRVVEKHQKIIEQWGDWRWHSGPLEQSGVLRREIANHAAYTMNEFGRLRLRDLSEDSQRRYCEVLGCCLPKINATEAFATKIFSPEQDLTQQEVEYATGYRTNIRAGQSTAKAVLAAVRKTFKDQPEYIRLWERFFERMGQAWASTKSLTLSFSVAPSDFMRFGHLGEESCYRTGGSHENSKINLGLIENTIGIFFYRDGNAPEPGQGLRESAISGRAWGVVDPVNEGAVLTNIYKENWLTTRSSIMRALQESFGFSTLFHDQEIRGTLTPLGVRHSKKTWVFVNADQHIVSKEGGADEVHLTVGSWIDEFVETRSIQHGKDRVCLSCGAEGEDGISPTLCDHPHRCGKQAAEVGRQEVCPACVCRCDVCNSSGCAMCMSLYKCACGKNVCRTCVKEVQRGTGCANCGQGHVMCADCARNPEHTTKECSGCKAPHCDRCLLGCGAEDCVCEKRCGRCKRRELYRGDMNQPCYKCQNFQCQALMAPALGGVFRVCANCAAEEEPVVFDLPEGAEPLAPDDIRGFVRELRGLGEVFQEYYPQMHRYRWRAVNPLIVEEG